MSQREKILISFLTVLLLGSGTWLYQQARPSADAIPAASNQPFELAIFPDKLWRAGNTNTQFVIGLKGKGYTGNVTVDITGLPQANGDGIDGFIQCDSNCAPAGVGMGRPPYTVPVVDGQWKMFAPGVYPPIDATTESADQTYNLTVTASSPGYTDIVTATLFAEHQYEQGASDTLHQPGVPACASINDQASQPIRPANKLSVTAGGSVTFTCSWRAPETSNYLKNQWVDGTSLTFVSTHESANPMFEPTITGTFSRPSATFNKPAVRQCGGNPYTCTFDTSKDVVVDYLVQTSATTAPGVYVFAFGSKNPAGYSRVGPEGVLTVLPRSTPEPTTTTSSLSSSTPTTTSPSSTSSPTSQPTSSPSASSSSLPSSSPQTSASEPFFWPSATPTNVIPQPTNFSHPSFSTQTNTNTDVTPAPTGSPPPPPESIKPAPQLMVVSGVVTNAEGIPLPNVYVTLGEDLSDETPRQYRVNTHIESSGEQGSFIATTTDQYGYYVVKRSRSNPRPEDQRLSETLQVSAPYYPRPETTVTLELPYDITQLVTQYTKDIQLSAGDGPQLKFIPNPSPVGGQVTVQVTGFPPNQTVKLFMHPMIAQIKQDHDGDPDGHPDSTRHLKQSGRYWLQTYPDTRETGRFYDEAFNFPSAVTGIDGSATWIITAPRALSIATPMIATTTLDAIVPPEHDGEWFKPLTSYGEPFASAATQIFGVLPDSVGAFNILQTNYQLPHEDLIADGKQQLAKLGLTNLSDSITGVLTAAAVAPESIGNQVQIDTTLPEAYPSVANNPSVSIQFGGTTATTCQLAEATPHWLTWFSLVRPALAQLNSPTCITSRRTAIEFLNSLDPNQAGNIPTILNGLPGWLGYINTILAQSIFTPEQKNQITTDLSLIKRVMEKIQANYGTDINLAQLGQIGPQLENTNTAFRSHSSYNQTDPPTFKQMRRFKWQMLEGVKLKIVYFVPKGTTPLDNKDIRQFVDDRNIYDKFVYNVTVDPTFDNFLNNTGRGAIYAGATAKVTISLPDGTKIVSPPLTNQGDWAKFIQQHSEELYGKAYLFGFEDTDGKFKGLDEAYTNAEKVQNRAVTAINLSERLARLLKLDPTAFLNAAAAVLMRESQGTTPDGNTWGSICVYWPPKVFQNLSTYNPRPETAFIADVPMTCYIVKNGVVIDIASYPYRDPEFFARSSDEALAKANEWLKNTIASDYYRNSPGSIVLVAQYERGQYSKQLNAIQNELAAVNNDLQLALQSQSYEVLNREVFDGYYLGYQVRESDFRQSAGLGRSWLNWLNRALAAEINQSSESQNVSMPADIVDETEAFIPTETNYLRVSFQGVPANLIVTDPMGRSVGINPLNNMPLAQIPDAITGGGGTPNTTVYLPQIIKGSYNIVVTPLGDGEGTLWTESSIAGSEPEQSVITKTVQAGKPEIGSIEIDFDTQSAVSLGVRLRSLFLFSYRQAPIAWWIGSALLGILLLFGLRKFFRRAAHRPVRS